MKVTDEMTERACTYLNRYYDGKCDLDDARGAIEAALEDVPEPPDSWELFTYDRCKAAEDKLAKVREWALYTVDTPAWLLDILDGE